MGTKSLSPAEEIHELCRQRIRICGRLQEIAIEDQKSGRISAEEATARLKFIAKEIDDTQRTLERVMLKLEAMKEQKTQKKL